MYRRKIIDGLKSSLDKDLKNKMVDHRNRFINLFMGRYQELLPMLIEYDNIESIAVNQLKLENALRNNINVIIGEASNGIIMILGYVKSPNTDRYESPTDFLNSELIQKDDISFIVPKHLIPKTMKEISYYDDCKTGNFILLKNKSIAYVSDIEILQHYTVELAELVLSRFSIAIQSKVNTFLIGPQNDETLSEITSDLYNGSPYVKVSPMFDPKDNIVNFDNVGLANTFSELKREYQNKIAELNNMLGINSLAVEKESGVSDTEAKSNTGFTTSNANIYLASRQNELDKLNKRYGLNILARYNDEVKSQLLEAGKEVEEEDGNDSI